MTLGPILHKIKERTEENHHKKMRTVQKVSGSKNCSSGYEELARVPGNMLQPEGLVQLNRTNRTSA